MVVFVTAFKDVPQELHDAATVDGAGPVKRLFHVDIPLILPVVLLVTLVNIISAFKAFSLFYVMTRGGPGYATNILGLYLYTRAFRTFNLGYAASISVVLMVFVLIFSVFYVRLFIRRQV